MVDETVYFLKAISYIALTLIWICVGIKYFDSKDEVNMSSAIAFVLSIMALSLISILVLS
jgi:hypothetical protein